MAGRWFVARGKKNYGPYTFEQMKHWAEGGNVVPVDMVFQEGTVKWKPASEVEELLIPLFQREWYIVRGGVRYGPYSTERMQGFVAEKPPAFCRMILYRGS
jgi:hypothetical protein